MRSKLFVVFLSSAILGLLVLGSLSSCESKVDHIAVIQSLDSTFQSVETAEKKFNNINRFNTEQFFKGIKGDLDYVQASYKGEMAYDMAKLFADYRSITKLVKDFGHRHTRLKKEILRTKKQIFDLQSAIMAGATQDAEGNKFSNLYLETHSSQEVRIAKELVDEIDEMVERLKKAQARYDQVYPEIEAAFRELGIMPESES
ncbi:MAG: hypothetical protein ACI84C_001814 [Flavobacteriales bacterium]|jgi:hypothetical protein